MAKLIQKVHHNAVGTKAVAAGAPHTEGRIRAAAYCRVSTLLEEQELSFETQKSYYEKLIGSSSNMELVGIYADQGLSGLHADNRKELQNLMKDCRLGRVDVIYVKSISRFSRNLSECSDMVKELTGYGVRIIFEKEGIDTGGSGRSLYLNILSAMAQEESNSISQNIRWAHKMRNTKGDPIRVARYGYKRIPIKDGKRSNWLINEDEADRVRLMYRLALEGRCFTEIRLRLDEMEEAKGTGIKWTNYRVRAGLRDVAYKGDLYTGGHYTPDYITGKSRRNRGEFERYYITGHHEPIIPPDVWEDVQVLIGDRRKNSSRFQQYKKRLEAEGGHYVSQQRKKK